jgi:hypothetical protein
MTENSTGNSSGNSTRSSTGNSTGSGGGTRPAAMPGRSRVMRVLNVPMRAMLGLPFPTPPGGNLMLLRYTGRKTGKAYRVPVSYAREGSVLLTPGGGRWTLGLRGGHPVTLRLRGKDLTARPELVTDQAEVERLIGVIARENPRAAGFIPLPRLPDGRLEPKALAAAISHGFGIVRWHVGTPGQE